MPADGSSSGAHLARRRFLGALAAAPAALAGCSVAGAAGARSAGAPGEAGPERGPAAQARAPAPDAATRAVRDQPLPPDAEPAFVFRAGAVRPGEP
jgi:beta-lactamase class A